MTVVLWLLAVLATKPSTDPEPEPRWAGLPHASRYSAVPVKTLRRWIAQGLLPAWRIGPRNLQVDLNDLDRLRRRIPTAENRREASG